jgi:hypothetical protein
MIEVGSGPDIFQNRSIHQFRHDFISVVAVLLHHCGPTETFSNIQSYYAIWTECRHGIYVLYKMTHIWHIRRFSTIDRMAPHFWLLVATCTIPPHTHTLHYLF